MNKYIAIIAISSLLFSCNSKQGNLVVKGKITNFQKGKVYLEKMKDSLLIKVDSVTLDGKNEFVLSDNIERPQLYYIAISDSKKYLQFFAEKGTITVIDNLKTFGYQPKITGSKNQLVYDEFIKMNTKFMNKNLDLIKERFDVQTIRDTITRQKRLKDVEKRIKANTRRKYLYTINFATKYPDLEVAPYIILSELPNVNLKFLDTIKKAMTPKIKKSLYGKKLLDLLTKNS